MTYSKMAGNLLGGEFSIIMRYNEEIQGDITGGSFMLLQLVSGSFSWLTLDPAKHPELVSEKQSGNLQHQGLHRYA